MNRFARIGETADPCGVPWLRCSRARSGCASGAASHRSTYSSTQRQSVTAVTAFITRSHGTSSKNFWTSRSIAQSYFQHRCRHAAIASWATCAAGSHGSPGETDGPPAPPDAWPRPSARPCRRSSARPAFEPRRRAAWGSRLPDRGREVRPRAHPISDLVEFVRKIGLERLEILPVHPRRALIGPDPPPRLPDHRPGNHERLVFGHWHVRSLPPEAPAPVDRSDIPDQPAPWLHRHPSKQRLHGYYGPVRQRAPRRYSMPPVSAVGRLPLATLAAYDPGRRIDARLLTFRARAADQAHAASTPGTA